jgi:hypothetical protein
MEISPTIIKSPLFSKNSFQRQLETIKKASEVAQKKIDYTSAHDDEVLRAIEVVEDFLRKKHRLCYGGQAINAHLPTKYKIYDPDYSVPDYDFFTPDQEGDIKTLVKDLRKAGFTEISAREGMHEGTVKIYVSFIPVADMTAIDPRIYKVLSAKEFRYEGISYIDANTLRMFMYLELSRPRGEVERWSKVFERLSLFNEFVPVKICKALYPKNTTLLTEKETEFIMSLIISKKRTFAGADVVGYYRRSFSKKKQTGSWLLHTKKPIIFYSQDPENDAKTIRAEFNFIAGKSSTTTKHIVSKSTDITPSLWIVQRDDRPLIFIIEQSACSSYFTIPLDNNETMRIASIDTLITLYFSLGFIDPKYMDVGAIECLANQMTELSIRARSKPDEFPFPFISLKCSGYQTTLPSLIREKVRRITKKRSNMKELIKNNNRNNNTPKNRNNTLKTRTHISRLNKTQSNKTQKQQISSTDKFMFI